MLVIATFHPSKVLHQIDRIESLFEPETDPDDGNLYDQWPNKELNTALLRIEEVKKKGLAPEESPRKSTGFSCMQFGSPVAEPNKYMMYDTLTKTAKDRQDSGDNSGLTEHANALPFTTGVVHEDGDDEQDDDDDGAESQHKASSGTTLGWFGNILWNLILN